MQQRGTNTKGLVGRSPTSTTSFVTAGRLAATAAACVLLFSACSGGDDEGDAGSSELIGTWEVTDSNETWTVTDDAIAVSGGVVDGLSYTATNSTLELTDEAGPMSCPPAQIGVYEWEMDDDVLTLTLVSDSCSGRSEALNGRSLERSG